MKYLFTYFLLFIFQTVFAQEYNFQELLWGEPNDGPAVVSVTAINETNEKFILGYFKSEMTLASASVFSDQNVGVFLAKLSENDSLLWLKTIAERVENIPNSYLGTLSITLSDSSNVYIVIPYTGTLLVSDELFPSNDFDNTFSGFSILKINTDGNLLNHFKIAGDCDKRIEFLHNSIDVHEYISLFTGYEGTENSDSCYCLLGNDTTYVKEEQGFILKYDNSFENLLWKRKISKPGLPSLSDDKIYVFGVQKFYNNGVVDFGDDFVLSFPSSYNCGGYIAQYDVAGNFIWAKYFGQQGWDSHLQPLDIEVLGPNDIVLVGRSFTQSVPNRVYFENAPTLFGSPWGSDDYFLVNYDSLGNVKWHTIAKCDGWDRLIEATHDENKNIYLAGTFTDQLFFADDTLNSYGTDDVMVLAFDSLGNELWAKHAGGTSIDQSKGISIDSENNLYVVGGSASATSTFGSLEHSLTEVSMFYAKMSPTAVAIPEFDAKSNSLQLYPNPTNSYLQLNQKGNKTIYNLLGEEVLKTTQTNIDVSLLPQGIYILQWENQQKLFMKTNIEN